MDTSPTAGFASNAQRTQLDQIRNALLRLHKILLDSERLRYERAHGRIEDGFPLLNKVLHDPAFAWLREMSSLIVQIDEGLENDELSAVDARALHDQVRTLITPSESGDEFARNYHRALQESPEVVMAHGEVAPLLSE